MRHTPTTSRTPRLPTTLLGAATAVAIAATLHTTPASATTATTPWLKPVLGGLLDRQKPPPEAYQGSVDGYVVEVAWADLQPLAGAPLATNNAIDDAIATAKTRGLKLKLRVTAGIDTPQWAKQLGGDPIQVQDDYGNTGTIGRFWTARFASAYQDLQTKLAARYDNVPELTMTQITRCTTFYAEPFLRQARNPDSVTNLLAAGYTATLDEACHRQQVDTHKVWTHTRSGLSFNPYQRIAADGSVSNEVAFSQQMMSYCRQQLGARCVLENHSIRTLDQGPLYDDLYLAIRTLGGPICFQTAAPDRIGDLGGTLKWAVQQGAASVELPSSYRTTASPASLLSYNRQLTTIATAASSS